VPAKDRANRACGWFLATVERMTFGSLHGRAQVALALQADKQLQRREPNLPDCAPRIALQRIQRVTLLGRSLRPIDQLLGRRKNLGNGLVSGFQFVQAHSCGLHAIERDELLTLSWQKGRFLFNQILPASQITGRIAGYTHPKHEQHDEFVEWAGRFKAEAFDAKKATKAMRKGLPDWRSMS